MSIPSWAALLLAIGVGAILAVGLHSFLTDPAQAFDPSPEDRPGDSIPALFSEHPALEEVWWFDNDSKSWDIYVRAIEPKTLLELRPGEPYVFGVSEDVTIRGQRLTCKDEFCLNIITWE